MEIRQFAESAAYNIILQFTFKCSTFILNSCLLNFVSKELLGIVNVRLMLLYSTLNFFSGEPFRRGCISRMNDDDNGGGRSSNEKVKDKWQQMVNVVWLCPLVTLLFGVLLSIVWTSRILINPTDQQAQFYPQAVILFALAVFIEKLAEPLFVACQIMAFVKVKTIIEAIHNAFRQILFVTTTIIFPQYSLLNFGFSMVYTYLISSFAYCLMYYCYFYYTFGNGRDVKLSSNSHFVVRKFSNVLPNFRYGLDSNRLGLTECFASHSFVSKVLNESERYIMTFFNLSNFADQGIYDVICNLGSVIVRIIFTTVEEDAKVKFSGKIQRGRPLENQKKDSVLFGIKLLKSLLKFVSLIGFIITIFGLSYSYLALNVYGGQSLSVGPGPSLLRWYSFYVLLLALNGITESFSFAVMPESEINRHKKYLIVFCVLIMALHAFQPFGIIGYILVNCVSMILRILYSCNFIRRFFQLDLKTVDPEIYQELKTSPIRSLIPNVKVVSALLASVIFPFLSNIIFCCHGLFNTLAHCAVGGVCLFGVGYQIYCHEMESFDFIRKETFKNKN